MSTMIRSGSPARFAIAAVVCVVARMAVHADDVADDVPVTEIAELVGAGDSTAAGGESLRTEGVVTFRHDQPDRDRIVLVVQHGRAAVWVIAPYRECIERAEGFSGFSDDVRPGERVVVDGRLDPGAHGPRIIASSIQPRGREPLPAPLSAESSGVFRGAGGAVRTMLEGIVQIVRSDKGVRSFALDVDGRRVTVRSAHPPAPGVGDLMVDARVRVTGIAGSIRNARGQLLGPVLLINGFDDVERIAEPPSSAFESPFVPLRQIARFGSPSLDGHRFQTEGVVTRAQATRYLFIQEGGVGIRVETGDKEVFRPGDRVRVAGFVDMGRQLRGMTAAVTRRVGSESPPEPTLTTPAAITSGSGRPQADAAGEPAPDFAGHLVTFTATLADAGPTRDGGVLQLASGGMVLEATLLRDAYARAAAFAPGSEIALTGIVQYDVARSHEELVDGRLNPFERFTLLVHDAADVRLIRSPPWWTPMRLSAALTGAMVVLAAALAWAWSLRRQVARQAAAIAKEMRARREAAVEFQATLRERTRLAANLHDTLLQSMAGIGFQLEACQMSLRRSGEWAGDDAVEHLDVARRMVDHAVDDVRGSVWALRSAAVQGQSLTEALEALIARVGAGHRVAIRLRARGVPFELPNFVTGNLMLIVQEGVFNALRHAAPDTIAVDVAFDTELNSVELTVRDDGCGFAMGGQQGPEEGHFGLQGMRERAERLGGRFSVDSAPGAGTTVRCLIHCRDYDPEMERDDSPTLASVAADRRDPQP